MRKTLLWTLVAAVVVTVAIVWLSLMVGSPALAAGDGERVGENVGKLLGGWASLYVGWRTPRSADRAAAGVPRL